MKFEKLNVPEMPLHGRHLIEASAGTGKTYNITRLYLRLLLEKQLPVQKILVMTFTNAATEEIRGRLADTLREIAENGADTFYRGALAEKIVGDLQAGGSRISREDLAAYEPYPDADPLVAPSWFDCSSRISKPGPAAAAQIRATSSSVSWP